MPDLLRCTKEDILGLIFKTQDRLTLGFENWQLGQNEKALQAWPAQEFFDATGREDLPQWQERWLAAGGRLFHGRMVALKNDRVWTALSAFRLPYPPFDCNSWMEVQDVSRDEAVSLGLMDEDLVIRPQKRKLERDLAEILS